MVPPTPKVSGPPEPSGATNSQDFLRVRDVLTSADRHCAAVALEFARERDKIIASAISSALGRNDWQLWEVAPRIRRLQVEGQPQESWTLDGRPILELWPPDVETKSEGGSVKIVWTVKYRIPRRHRVEDRPSPCSMGIQRRIVSDVHTGPWVENGTTSAAWKAYKKSRRKSLNAGSSGETPRQNV